MSSIWDALKAALPFRAVKRKKQAKRRDHRHTRRVVGNVPLFVYGSNVDRQPFHEDVYTLDLNEGGCLVSMKAEVVHGQRLWIINTENESECDCRVVHKSKRFQGRAFVGVGFLQPDPRFWDMVLL